MNTKRSFRENFLWPLFFLLTFLEAAVAFLILLRVPGEGARLVLGFSPMRWALLVPLMFAMAASLLMARMTRRRPALTTRWLEPTFKPGLFSFLIYLFALLTLAAGCGWFLLRWYDPGKFLPFYERAWPLLAFVFLFSFQAVFLLISLRAGIRKAVFPAGKPSLVTFLVLLLVFGLVAATGLGLIPDESYWGEPGVPVQGWQLVLALLGGSLILIISLQPFFKSRVRLVEFILPVFLWLLAAGIWLSVPNEVLKNSFYFPIDPPANTPFPYSDSGYYDYMAHSLLIGTDYIGNIPTRPLYIVFLATLHAIFGERYDLIIATQTLILAFIPVVLYALGRTIHSRAAGLTIALLAIFREWNALLVSSDTRVSNSKTLLVDLPTLLLILVACLLALRWLQKKDRLSAFIAGGAFGILILLRTQSMLILPALFLVAFLALRSQKQAWLFPLAVFVLGLIFSVTPWLTHNFLRSGQFSFDAPFQYQVIASQYSYNGLLDYKNTNLEGKSLASILITFFLDDPGFVIGFVANHFLATQIGSLLALPLIAPFSGLRAPIHVYWTSFNGALNWDNTLLLVGYIGVISVGLGAAWKRMRWMGLLPLAFNLGYALANGIGRFSGWRYDLPADWIAYFYFGLGAVEIFVWIIHVFGGKGEDLPLIGTAASARSFFKFLPYAAGFALIGALPWLAEVANSPRYPSLAPEAIQQKLICLPAVQEFDITAGEIQAFANQPEAASLTGRALYPRAFPRQAGLSSSNPWQAYAIRDYHRLGFLVLNRNVRQVVLPIKLSQVANIHAMHVLVLGCEQEGFIEARLVVFPESNLAYVSDAGLARCTNIE